MSEAAAGAARLRTDRRIIAFFLFAFAAGGVVQPFINLYLVEVGLSAAQIGALQGWAALASVALTPFIGLLADRTQRHRLLLALIVAIKGLSAPLLLLHSGFFWLAATVGLRRLTAGSQDALMNRLTLAHLHANRRLDFGAIRFWGGVSFAATSLLTGWLAQDASVSVLFPLSGVLGLAAATLAGAFPGSIVPRPSQPDASSLVGFARRTLPRGLLFLFVAIFFSEVARSGQETFGFVYLKGELGAGNALIGLLGAVGSLAPLPAFLWADRLVHRAGATRTFACGLAAYALAWGGYALLQHPAWALGLVAMQGVGSALCLVALVVLLGELGPPEKAATNQMLAQLTVPGLAAIFAQPLSGLIYSAFGGATLFALEAGLIGLVAGLLFARPAFFSGGRG